LMGEMGLDAYRFSISWPRVIPKGIGDTNSAGLDFYDRLIDELLKFNIKPFVTLFHGDYPQALQDEGGWANPDSVKWYADYVDMVTRSFGNRVKHWITHNQPGGFAMAGYFYGQHPPGLVDMPTAYKVAHHLLLSHGAAVPVIHENVEEAQVGITLYLTVSEPASDSEDDQKAALRNDGFVNRWFLDPIFKGQYPADMVEALGENLQGIDLDSVKDASEPIDFLGVNYYSRERVTWRPDLLPLQYLPAPLGNVPTTASGWEIYPQGLTKLLLRVQQDYRPKAVYITENGAAFDDPPSNGVIVDDMPREEFLQDHLAAVETAIGQGVPLKGYFVWSLLDNFEWAEGYSKRFGIYSVNYENQARIPKRSAQYYKRKIATEKARAM
jgi:beta-glucosidase